jgi:hypothetical protein
MNRASVLAASALGLSGCLLILPIERVSDSNPGPTTTTAMGTGGTSGAGGGGGSSGVPDGGGVDGGCTSNAACSTADRPAMCRARDHNCVDLVSNECLVVHGDWRNPNAVHIGAYTHLPPIDVENWPILWNYEFAVDEINMAGGLPDNQMVAHPLVLVVCSSDPPGAGMDPFAKSLPHLVDDLEVPAIVADLLPEALISVFQKTHDEATPVFFLSPGPANNALANLQDDNLVWHMGGLVRDLAPAYQSLVKQVEQHIKKNAAISTVKVAVVTTTDAVDPTSGVLGELLQAVKPMLQFNEQGVAANEAAGNYKEFVVDATHSPRMVAQDIINWGDPDKLGLGPHIVISMLGGRYTEPTMQSAGVALALEQTLGGMRTRPYHILNPINYGALPALQAIISGIGLTYPSTYEHFVGINLAGAEDSAPYHTYLERIRHPFPQAPEDLENFYDPIYYVAYSMYLAGVEKHLDGSAVEAGMLRLLGGKRFDVGADDILAIFDELRDRQRSIQLRGTVGLPLFHLDNGARFSKGALLCFDKDVKPHLDPIFDPTTGTWSADFPCYAGFP